LKSQPLKMVIEANLKIAPHYNIVGL